MKTRSDLKPTPEKYCAQCGKRLERKRTQSGLESMPRFLQRCYCNRACARAVRSLSKRYVLTEAMRQTLRARYDSSPQVITELCALWGVPRWKVIRWARDEGLTHMYRPWSRAELEELERLVPTTSLREIGRRLNRPWEGVQQKLYRLGLYKKQEGYLMDDLLLGFGCTRQRVHRWMDKGWLRGQKRQTERGAQQGDYWFFSESDLRLFICKHGMELDPRRFDWVWIHDLAFGGTRGVGPHFQPVQDVS